MTDPSAETTAALAHVPLFTSCSREAIEAIASAGQPRQSPAGAVIVREGEPGSSLFVILAGQVRVVSDAASERILLARLGPGEFFGEMALLAGGTRTAAVVAETNATLLELRQEEFHALMEGDTALGREVAATMARRLAASQQRMLEDGAALAPSPDAPPVITIGRDRSNTIVVSDPAVRAHHAEIRRTAEGIRIRDLGDAIDTFVNHQPVLDADLADGDEIQVGSARFFVDSGRIRRVHTAAGIRVEATGLEFALKDGSKLLNGVDIAISPGELVAIVGPSGAGKTTLLHTLLGLIPPSAGKVYFDSLSLADHADLFRPAIGYVPQQDIIHEELSVRDALEFAGRLRLPHDTTSTELHERVAQVLEHVGLSQRATMRIGRLSGGQRKRTCIGAELLTWPRVFFLDEPTSGLDPGLDAQMMRTFRDLADEGRTVILTTHATRNIELCDRVIVVSAGRLVFTGTPRAAMEHFQLKDFAELYTPLAATDPGTLAAAFRDSPGFQQNITDRLSVGHAGETADRQVAGAGPVRTVLRRTGHLAHQFRYLAARDLRVALADRLTLAVRLFGAPLLAASLVTTFERHIFALTAADGGNARAGLTLLYLAAATTLFLGAFTASNAITRERAIYRRERMVDLSPLAYVASKVVVLSVFSILQGVIVAVVLTVGIELPSPGSTAFSLAVIFALTSAAGMGLGLLVSALSPNADRAAILTVLLIIPQLIFAGSSVPRSEMGPMPLAVSDGMVSKWSLEALGQATGLDARFREQSILHVDDRASGVALTVEVPDRPYEHAFRGAPGIRWAALAGFALVFICATYVVQLRRRA